MDVKYAHLLAMSAAASALLIFAAAQADAQQRPATGGRINLPGRSNHFSWERGHGFRGGFGGVWVVEREVPVIVEREVVVEVPVPAEPPPAPPPRDPYVIGKSYASLPGGCMKIVEPGASYYWCGGEWYRQVGKEYRAVRQP